jgi:hypothetical protein
MPLKAQQPCVLVLKLYDHMVWSKAICFWQSGLQVVPMSLSHLCSVHLHGTARTPNLQGVLIASLSAKVHTKP